MKIRRYILPILAALILWGCADKEDNTPSYADKDRLEELLDKSLTKVVDFRDQYGTYLIYNFDQELDFAYQFEEATNWQNATIERLSQEEAVNAVDFLCQEFFSKYSEDFKKHHLPRKVLLVKSLKAQTLGISEPNSAGYHQAAANVSSMTIAYDKAKISTLDDAGKQSYLRQLHSILLAGYMINVRAEYPVAESYVDFSQTYYSSLMDPKRTQARHLPDEFFLDRGFFRPADDESTYFVSAEEDMIAFARQLINMDVQLQDSLADFPIMESKLGLMANGLKNIGVDIETINPIAKYYLEIGVATTPPSIIAKEAITPKPTADFNFTILRGSRNLNKAEIWVNGALQHTIDLTDKAEEARVDSMVVLSNLKEGDNPVEVKVFEEGRPRPSAIKLTSANFVSKASYMHIENSLGEKYRLHVYSGYDYTEGSSNADVNCLRFRKLPTEVDMNTGVDNSEQYFWVVKKENGLVKSIVVKKEVIDFENNKNSYEPQFVYYFNYNDKDELESVKKDNETIVSEVKYAGGLMTSFKYEGKAYTPLYDTSVTPAIRTDCMDEQLSGHRFIYHGNETLNYFYQPDLPAVIPGSVCGVPLQLVYSKYLFTELEDVWSNKWLLEGNTNMTEVTIGDVTWTYTFVLQ